VSEDDAAAPATGADASTKGDENPSGLEYMDSRRRSILQRDSNIRAAPAGRLAAAHLYEGLPSITGLCDHIRKRRSHPAGGKLFAVGFAPLRVPAAGMPAARAKPREFEPARTRRIIAVTTFGLAATISRGKR